MAQRKAAQLQAACRGRLRDFVLDWEDALPDEQLDRAESEADRADVILCLGTSLQIKPICDLPTRATKRGGAFALVNLQKTPKDKHARVIAHARCDDVMRRVMHHLRLQVPPFIRRDRLALRAWVLEADADEARHASHACSCAVNNGFVEHSRLPFTISTSEHPNVQNFAGLACAFAALTRPGLAVGRSKATKLCAAGSNAGACSQQRTWHDVPAPNVGCRGLHFLIRC